MEQPELGATNVGVDAAQIMLTWSWEGGWSLRCATRLSGSPHWQTHSYDHLSPDEAMQLVEDSTSELLGLV